MTIESPEGTGIGSCLEPFAALINHSCDPNSAFFFEGPELRIRSMKTIKTGDEITISYTNPTESFDFRQKQLSNYHFICKCKKCEKEGLGERKTEDIELKRPIKESQDLLRELLQSDLKTTSPESIEASANRICSEGYPGKCWPCDMPPISSLQIALAHLFHEKQSWLKVYSLWLKTCFKTDPAIWPSQFLLRRVENFMHYITVEG
jgi:hypothetical protein